MSGGVCWILADDKPGNVNPCRGLAEAVGLATVEKRIRPRWPWSALPPWAWLAPMRAGGRGSDPLAPPWPDLLIAAGRQTVAPAAAIRRLARGRCFAVQILNPRFALDAFDLVAPPAHDRLAGANVLATVGAINRVTPARLAAEAARVAPSVAALPAPRVAALIGGGSRHHRMTPADAAAIGARLAALARDHGAGLMVTASRRTGDANTRALREALAGVAATVWDGAGHNPYFGYLGLAEAIVVTADSVAMVSEACTTGKPVSVIDLPGGSAKLDRFHADLRARGMTRPFDGRLDSWDYPPLAEAERVAAAVRRAMDRG